MLDTYGSGGGECRDYLLEFLDLEDPASRSRAGSSGERQVEIPHVEISEHRNAVDDSGKSHVVHVVQVRFPAGEAAEAVEKRYTEFETLRTQLQDKTISFPPKGGMMGLSEAKLKARRYVQCHWTLCIFALWAFS